IGSGDYAGEDIIINGHVMIAGGTYNWKNLTISPMGILDSQGETITLNISGNLRINWGWTGWPMVPSRGVLRTSGNELVTRTFTLPNGTSLTDTRAGENAGDLTIKAISVVNQGQIMANGYSGGDAQTNIEPVGGGGGGYGGRITIIAQHLQNYGYLFNQPGTIGANGGSGGRGARHDDRNATTRGRPGAGINGSVMSTVSLNEEQRNAQYPNYYSCTPNEYTDDDNDWGGCPGYSGLGGSGGSGLQEGAYPEGNDAYGGGGGGGSAGIINLSIYNLQNKGHFEAKGGDGGNSAGNNPGGSGGMASFGKDFTKYTSSGFPGAPGGQGTGGGGGSGGLVDIEEGTGLAKSGLSIQKTILKGDVDTNNVDLDNAAQIASNIGPGEIVTVRLEVVNSAGQENVTITDEIL
ncbi:MAG: hypothetical protein COX39_00320, partial [Candidatus Nealsonbacteria bacterium CG23_combo_of_CG06-09_8_20_14_all_40_13]